MFVLLLLPFAFAIVSAIAYEKGGSFWLWAAFLAALGAAFMMGGSLFAVAIFAIPFFVITVSLNGTPRTGDPFALALRAMFAASVTMVLMLILGFFLMRFIRIF